MNLEEIKESIQKAVKESPEIRELATDREALLKALVDLRKHHVNYVNGDFSIMCKPEDQEVIVAADKAIKTTLDNRKRVMDRG